MQLSLAIPVYNRAKQVINSFTAVLGDPRIGEIVLCDDASEDYEDLEEEIHRLGSVKVKLFQNLHNLKAFHNKAKAVSLCQNDWVILLDSDNCIDSTYLDAFFGEGSFCSQILYCPSFARPHFDFSSLANMLLKAEDLFLLSQFAEAIEDERIGASIWSALINCGNYVFHRETYLSVYKTYEVFADFVGEPYAADVAYLNVLWLRQGYGMKIVPNMEYDHPISADAFSFCYVQEKNHAYQKILSLFLDYCYKLQEMP
ncbi:MAG: glycosyltransferase [Thermostichales cyanobacterium BF4_bins_65]